MEQLNIEYAVYPHEGERGATGHLWVSGPVHMRNGEDDYRVGVALRLRVGPDSKDIELEGGWIHTTAPLMGDEQTECLYTGTGYCNGSAYEEMRYQPPSNGMYAVDRYLTDEEKRYFPMKTPASVAIRHSCGWQAFILRWFVDQISDVWGVTPDDDGNLSVWEPRTADLMAIHEAVKELEAVLRKED